MANARVSLRHALRADLAADLKLARLRRGLGLRETARLAHVDAGHLCKIEQGERCPSVAVARSLIAALQLGKGALAARLIEAAQPDVGQSRDKGSSWDPPSAAA